jgi:hypothetical protein
MGASAEPIATALHHFQDGLGRALENGLSQIEKLFPSDEGTAWPKPVLPPVLGASASQGDRAETIERIRAEDAPTPRGATEASESFGEKFRRRLAAFQKQPEIAQALHEKASSQWRDERLPIETRLLAYGASLYFHDSMNRFQTGYVRASEASADASRWGFTDVNAELKRLEKMSQTLKSTEFIDDVNAVETEQRKLREIKDWMSSSQPLSEILLNPKVLPPSLRSSPRESLLPYVAQAASGYARLMDKYSEAMASAPREGALREEVLQYAKWMKDNLQGEMSWMKEVLSEFKSKEELAFELNLLANMAGLKDELALGGVGLNELVSTRKQGLEDAIALLNAGLEANKRPKESAANLAPSGTLIGPFVKEYSDKSMREGQKLLQQGSGMAASAMRAPDDTTKALMLAESRSLTVRGDVMARRKAIARAVEGLNDVRDVQKWLHSLKWLSQEMEANGHPPSPSLKQSMNILQSILDLATDSV